MTVSLFFFGGYFFLFNDVREWNFVRVVFSPLTPCCLAFSVGLSRSEVAIAACNATVLKYNTGTKRWEQAGSGPSRVEIYRNTTNNAYRVVGRNIRDASVVINSMIYPGLVYQRATETFHQWKDTSAIFGLNFANKDDANIFGMAMEKQCSLSKKK